MAIVTRRSFLAALGMTTAAVAIPPLAFPEATTGLPGTSSPSGPVIADGQEVSFNNHDLELMAKYALQELERLLPGKHGICKPERVVYFTGAHFSWMDDDPKVLKDQFDFALSLLASDIRHKGITSYAVPSAPKALEFCVLSTNPRNNMSIRLVRAYDWYENRTLNRIDVAGA